METLLHRHTFLVGPPPARWVGGGPTNRWPNEQWSDNKMFPDVILCWYREPIRQNESQETRFSDFSALAQEVDKTNPKRLDLMTFRPWLQKSTKPVPGCSIWWLSGHGSRSRQNQSQEARFDDFPAMAPEVDKTSRRRLDLMIFEPWIQESTKQWLSWTLNDPEYSFWDTRRIALGDEKYRFCWIKLWFSYIYAKSHQEPPWAPR